jgi:hypothetical protein
MIRIMETLYYASNVAGGAAQGNVYVIDAGPTFRVALPGIEICADQVDFVGSKPRNIK